MIDAQVKRGSAELAILTVLEDGPLHGYEIGKRIENQTGGRLQFTLASLYPLLYRMETQGWLKAKWENASGTRRRRYYQLTATGKQRLAPLREQWSQLFHALNSLAGATNG